MSRIAMGYRQQYSSNITFWYLLEDILIYTIWGKLAREYFHNNSEGPYSPQRSKDNYMQTK